MSVPNVKPGGVAMAELIGDVDELIGLIRRAATQSVLDAEEEARRQSEEIVAAATEKAHAVQAQAHAAAQRDAEADYRRSLAQADLDLQEEHLHRREALLDRAWTEAETRLHALVDSPGYAVVLQRLAQAAATALGSDPVLLAADAKGHALLTPERLADWSQAAGVRFQRQREPAAIWGGLMAADETERRVVDSSFASRLALAREALREEIADILELR